MISVLSRLLGSHSQGNSLRQFHGKGNTRVNQTGGARVVVRGENRNSVASVKGLLDTKQMTSLFDRVDINPGDNLAERLGTDNKTTKKLLPWKSLFSLFHSQKTAQIPVEKPSRSERPKITSPLYETFNRISDIERYGGTKGIQPTAIPHSSIIKIIMPQADTDTRISKVYLPPFTIPSNSFAQVPQPPHSSQNRAVTK